MNLLLDTHIIIWLLSDDSRLKPRARQAIERADAISISEVSLWEISIKRSVGKLLPIPGLRDTLVQLGFQRLHITDAQLDTYEGTLIKHKDPFDRLLMSQAITENTVLVTCDKKILEANIPGLHTIDGRV